jgi:hypothetical protein
MQQILAGTLPGQQSSSQNWETPPPSGQSQQSNTPSYLTKDDLTAWWKEQQQNTPQQKQSYGQPRTGQQQWVNPYGVPQYGVAPNLLPYNAQPYYKFKTNYAPGPGSFLPPGFNPSGAKNFNYDYRGRFFGQGPRRVKMSWDEISQNGQQTPVQNPNIQNPVDPQKMQQMQEQINGQELPYQFPDTDPTAGYAKWGGSYKQGGTYELNANQIQQIMDAGGEIEYID